MEDAAGQAVRHPQYGEGKIVRVEEGNVVCRFAKQGEKAFSEFFCPLEILGT